MATNDICQAALYIPHMLDVCVRKLPIDPVKLYYNHYTDCVQKTSGYKRAATDTCVVWRARARGTAADIQVSLIK